MTTKTMLILGLIAGFGGSDIIIDQAFAQQPGKNNVQDQIIDLDERVSLIEDWQYTIEGLIIAIQSEFDSRISTLENQFNGIAPIITGLVDDIFWLKQDIQYLYGTTDSAWTSIENLQLDLVSIWDEIGSIHSTDNAQSQRITDLEQDTDILKDTLNRNGRYTVINQIYLDPNQASSVTARCLDNDLSIGGGYDTDKLVKVFRLYPTSDNAGMGWVVSAHNTGLTPFQITVNTVCLELP